MSTCSFSVNCAGEPGTMGQACDPSVKFHVVSVNRDHEAGVYGFSGAHGLQLIQMLRTRKKLFLFFCSNLHGAQACGLRLESLADQIAVANVLFGWYNPVIRGWWNYHGAFYRTVMYKLMGFIDPKLEQWARRKYKTLSRRKQGSADWLRQMKCVYPGLFFHWSVAGNKVG